MRLIDADELKKALAKNITIWTFNVSYDGILADIIDNAPTVEAKTITECITAYGDGYESARRLYARPLGKWIWQTDFDGFTYWKCSNCNKKNEIQLFDFCPNCGADIRGKEE